MKIAIIGAGNIGGAVARGWYKDNPQAEVTVSGVHWEKLNRIKEDCPTFDVMVDNRKAVGDADLTVLAVKPWQVEGVINDV